MRRVDQSPELRGSHDVGRLTGVAGLDEERLHAAPRHRRGRRLRRTPLSLVIDVEPGAEPVVRAEVTRAGRLGATDGEADDGERGEDGDPGQAESVETAASALSAQAGRGEVDVAPVLRGKTCAADPAREHLRRAVLDPVGRRRRSRAERSGDEAGIRVCTSGASDLQRAVKTAEPGFRLP